MTEIKRYEMNHKGLPEPDDKGVWMFHEDHASIVAALQEQALALAAEAGRMKKAIKQVFPLGVDDENGKIGFSGIAKECYASALQTAATDAFIREIHAQAMDEAAEEVDEWVGNDLLAQELRKKSARIRAGEQS